MISLQEKTTQKKGEKSMIKKYILPIMFVATLLISSFAVQPVAAATEDNNANRIKVNYVVKQLPIEGFDRYTEMIQQITNQLTNGKWQVNEQVHPLIKWAFSWASKYQKGQNNEAQQPKQEQPVEQPKEETPAQPAPQKPVTPEQPKQEQPVEQPKEKTPAQPAPQKPVTPEQPKQEQPVEQPKEETPVQPAPQKPATPEQPKQENPAQASSLSEFERQVVQLTNAERAKAGLAPLQIDEELSRVAREKSRDMAVNRYFSHTSPTYGSPFDMMRSYGINYRAAGENIAKGQRSPQEVVNAWMNSQGHRENIMSPNFTHIGVGHVESGNHWTQMFIGK